MREKIIKKYGSSCVIVLSKEDRQILNVNVGDVVYVTTDKKEEKNDTEDLGTYE